MWERLASIGFFLVSLILMLRLQFWRLRVRDGVFDFSSVFGHSKKFLLRDVDSLSYIKDVTKTRYITLYSKKKVLIQVSSSKTGFETLLKLLQREGILSVNQEFHHDIPVIWTTEKKHIETESEDNQSQQVIEHELEDSIAPKIEEDLKNKIIEIFKDNYDDGFYLFDEISPSELRYAGVSSMSQLDSGEEIILYYTDKKRRFLKAGLLLTTSHLYTKIAGERAKSVGISEIESISIRDGKLLPRIIIKLNGKKEIVFVIERTKEEQEAFVEKLNLTIELLK